MVKLNHGGTLELGEDEILREYDKRGRILTTIKPGEPGYQHWRQSLEAAEQKEAGRREQALLQRQLVLSPRPLSLRETEEQRRSKR